MTKTYKIEQASYNLLWHKSREMQEKYELNRLAKESVWRYAQPTSFNIYIYDKNKNMVAFLNRNTYNEAQKVGKEYCGGN